MKFKRRSKQACVKDRFPPGKPVVTRDSGGVTVSWKFEGCKYPSLHALIQDDAVLLYSTNARKPPFRENNPPRPLSASFMPVRWLQAVFEEIEK